MLAIRTAAVGDAPRRVDYRKARRTQLTYRRVAYGGTFKIVSG
ncbi:hypothetical protein HerbRD11066_42520 [Herbidospora sp. RD11066]